MAGLSSSADQNQSAQVGDSNAAQRQSRGAQSWSFHNNQVGPVAAGTGGDYLTKLRTLIGDCYKEIAPGIDVSILTLSRTSFTQLRFSALIVAVTMKNVDAGLVAYHTLIIEGTGRKLEPIQQNIDNQLVRITRTTSDAWDNVLRTLAAEAVSGSFPGKRFKCANALVVPSTVTIEDKDTVENIARLAAIACVTEINIDTPFQPPLDLTTIDRDSRFVIDMAVGNHQVVNAVGHPNRSQVVITTRSTKKVPNQYAAIDTVNAPESSVTVCELSGFMNVLWSPLNQNLSPFAQHQQFQQGQVPNSKFAAEFVITDVRNDFSTTPAATLFALATALTMVENDNWLQVLMPQSLARSEKGTIDLTDIGALNVTANITGETAYNGFGKPVDLSQVANRSQIAEYLGTIFQPGCVISIDIPESAPSSWYLAPFAGAYDKNSSDYRLIIAAANELTGGEFSRHFPAGSAIFTSVVRMPLGYYNRGDKKCDIRTVDYTALCNVYAGDPSIVNDWSRSFEVNSANPIRQLAAREGIIQHALSDSAVITGYAARYTFSADFLTALSRAIASVGLPTTINTPMNVDLTRNGVSAPAFIGMSRVSDLRAFGANPNVGGGFSYHYGYFNNR